MAKTLHPSPGCCDPCVPPNLLCPLCISGAPADVLCLTGQGFETIGEPAIQCGECFNGYTKVLYVGTKADNKGSYTTNYDPSPFALADYCMWQCAHTGTACAFNIAKFGIGVFHDGTYALTVNYQIHGSLLIFEKILEPEELESILSCSWDEVEIPLVDASALLPGTCNSVNASVTVKTLDREREPEDCCKPIDCYPVNTPDEMMIELAGFTSIKRCNEGFRQCFCDSCELFNGTWVLQKECINPNPWRIYSIPIDICGFSKISLIRFGENFGRLFFFRPDGNFTTFFLRPVAPTHRPSDCQNLDITFTGRSPLRECRLDEPAGAAFNTFFEDSGFNICTGNLPPTITCTDLSTPNAHATIRVFGSPALCS